MQWGNKRIRCNTQLAAIFLALYPAIISALQVNTRHYNWNEPVLNYWKAILSKMVNTLKMLSSVEILYREKKIDSISIVLRKSNLNQYHMFVFSYLLFRQHIIWEQIQLWNKTIENLAVTTERKDVDSYM